MPTSDHIPPITDDMRRAARQMPGSWLYAIDPAYDPNGEVPPHGIVGAWKIDDFGNITDEFRSNPDYRPSPVQLGLDASADALDEAIRLAATGHGDEQAVTGLILDTELLVPVEGDDDIPVSVIGDQRMISVFSSASHVPGDVQAVLPIRGRDLVHSLPEGVGIAINPASDARVRIRYEDLPRKR